jgi:uncharacterized protein DUF3943
MGSIATWRATAVVTALSCALTSKSHATELEQPLPAARDVPGQELPQEELDEDRVLRPVRADPTYGRAAVEMLGVLAIGVAQYWVNSGTNSRDWDFPTWTDRLNGSGVRFDNNTHVTNNVLHPFAGAAYYGLSRANGLGVGMSSLYTVISSLAWETAEWREKISINDMVATTIGGISAGEFLIQLGSYLNSAPGDTTVAQDVAKGTLGFPIWVHDRIDGRRPDPRPARDNLGFSSAYTHRFTVGYENGWLANAGDVRQETRGFALEGNLVSMRGYLDPETFDTAFAQGNFTSGALAMQFDDSGLRDAEMKFDAVLAGFYTQHADPGVASAMLGLATGLEFSSTDTLRQGDQYALLHCAGPQLAAAWKSGGYQLDLRVGASADFAAIRSLAWPAVHSKNPDEVYKSSLERRYQYNVGLSTRLSGEVRLYAARIFAEVALGSYRSIQGMDRFQEEITRDVAGSERLDERRAGFSLEPPGTPLRFYAQLDRVSHVSWLGGQMGERYERRSLLGAGLVF